MHVDRPQAHAVAALAQLPTAPAPQAPATRHLPANWAGKLIAGAKALVQGRVVDQPICFREVRFRIGFECPCGAKVDLHQDHEQHVCLHCQTIYRLDGVAPAAVAWLRARRTEQKTP